MSSGISNQLVGSLGRWLHDFSREYVKAHGVKAPPFSVMCAGAGIVAITAVGLKKIGEIQNLCVNNNPGHKNRVWIFLSEANFGFVVMFGCPLIAAIGAGSVPLSVGLACVSVAFAMNTIKNIYLLSEESNANDAANMKKLCKSAYEMVALLTVVSLTWQYFAASNHSQ